MCLTKAYFPEKTLVLIWRNRNMENPTFPLIVSAFNYLTVINACHIFNSNSSSFSFHSLVCVTPFFFRLKNSYLAFSPYEDSYNLESSHLSISLLMNYMDGILKSFDVRCIIQISVKLLQFFILFHLAFYHFTTALFPTHFLTLNNTMQLTSSSLLKLQYAH